ncbi:MAG TPA: HAMP domain-containing sensor histidine kinase [Thermomicrobiales bacterium]|nr:HAMP domain-containing sensor histidine kinase [Thermomicrobiales bacterium]
MSLQWFEGPAPHFLISSSEDATSQLSTTAPELNEPLPPWLDIAFLNRLDALNASATAVVGRQAHIAHDVPISESIATFAHDIRTPLATLHASLEILADGTPPDTCDLQHLAGTMQRGVTWITQLVAELARQSETSHGTGCWGTPVTSGPTEVRDWIEQAIEIVQPLAGTREQAILFSCPQPSPVVEGDHVQFGQVIVNLLTNACRYGSWGDTIAVSVSERLETVTIRVSDHGMGILPDERERIFERRARGTQTGSHLVPGQGLGLYIVRGIVERHGGSVTVESALGQGSTFAVHLPAARPVQPLFLRRAVVREDGAIE